MNVADIKSKLHHLIDVAEDETALEAALQVLENPQPDVLDDLSPADLAKLDLALEQARRGEGILWSDYKKKLDLWLAERR